MIWALLIAFILAALFAAAAWWRGRNVEDPVPRLTNWLLRRAMQEPYFAIVKPDGSTYMDRWWVFNPDWYWSRKKWLGVRWLKWLPAARIHCTWLSDSDRHLHDHPWNNISIILRGWYWEEMPANPIQDPEMDAFPTGRKTTLRLPLVPVFRRATDRHRLVIQDGECCLSLFIMFPRQRDWGFWTENGWVYWRDYLKMYEEDA